MKEGWISLNRKILENELWQERPFDKARAWIDLLLLANYEDKQIVYKGELITCKRGDVNLSFLYLADRWGWSRWKVTNFIQTLVLHEMCTTDCTTHRTTITIVNYDKYQVLPTTKRTTKDTTNRQPNPQPTDITNKDNNINNKNNIKEKSNKKESHFVPPTLDEVKAYCKERNNAVDPERFVDFYLSKGWKVGNQPMKDWKAAVRTWERKDKQTKPKNFEQRSEYDFNDIERLMS